IDNGINWAWLNGADIISNAYCINIYDRMIETAIVNALNNGCNGKVCVIVYRSGNIEYLITEFLANIYDRIIVVGAMSPCGERANPSSCDGQTGWGSSYGQKLDVVAPGVYIPTTELSGNAGWNPGDYDLDFLGTSAAAPHIAAVAGLILS